MGRITEQKETLSPVRRKRRASDTIVGAVDSEDYSTKGDIPQQIQEARMVNESILKEATERIVSRFHPQRIILFGSQARYDADDRSDVDLLIICPVKGDRRDLMVAIDRALRGLPMARDIVILTPEEYERDKRIPGTVARPASKEGRVLYEAA